MKVRKKKSKKRQRHQNQITSNGSSSATRQCKKGWAARYLMSFYIPKRWIAEKK